MPDAVTEVAALLATGVRRMRANAMIVAGTESSPGQNTSETGLELIAHEPLSVDPARLTAVDEENDE